MKIAGKIFKFFVFGLIIFLFGFMSLRVLTSGDTKIAESFFWTDNAKNSYGASPDGFRVYSADLTKDYTDDGMFRVSNIRYAESETGPVSQLQFTVRWNDSTVKYLQQDFGLAEPPAGEPFVFTLADDLGNVYAVQDMTADSKPLYNYRRLAFDVPDFGAAETYYVNIYYSGTYDAETSASVKGSDGSAYGTLAVYRTAVPMYDYTLKKSELPDEG